MVEFGYLRNNKNEKGESCTRRVAKVKTVKRKSVHARGRTSKRTNYKLVTNESMNARPERSKKRTTCTLEQTKQARHSFAFLFAGRWSKMSRKRREIDLFLGSHVHIEQSNKKPTCLHEARGWMYIDDARSQRLLVHERKLKSQVAHQLSPRFLRWLLNASVGKIFVAKKTLYRQKKCFVFIVVHWSKLSRRRKVKPNEIRFPKKPKVGIT